MARSSRVIVSVVLGLLAGCSNRPSTSNPGPEPPHHGNLIKVPGAKINVEVVQKQVTSPKTPIAGEVTFYFLKEDATTLVSPPPSGGTLTVGKQKIALQPEGEGLTTPNGPPLFAKTGGVDGTLSVELDGKTLNVPLGVR
jgi:hypothetical protein